MVWFVIKNWGYVRFDLVCEDLGLCMVRFVIKNWVYERFGLDCSYFRLP